MIRTYTAGPDGLCRHEALVSDSPDVPVVWVDLIDPTAEEVAATRTALDAIVLTRAELREAGLSSRLAFSGEATFISFSAPITEDFAVLDTVSCVLSPERLVTLRKPQTLGFDAVGRMRMKPGGEPIRSIDVLFALIEAIVDRLSDLLDDIGAGIDRILSSVFGAEAQAARSTRRVRALLNEVGRHGSSITKAQDCLQSLHRVGQFMRNHMETLPHGKSDHAAISAVADDVHSLQEFAEALDSKVEFLLDAMLGIIQLDQNDIMKAMSLMAALFLPATLISSVFGMNFRDMPTLAWHWGFLFSLGIMVGTMLLLLLVFRWRRWM